MAAQGSADIVIVGAGHGGAQAAIALRQQGYAGSILMIGREPVAPYERPPLSKDYLAREKPFERIMIRPAQFWADKKVTLKLGSGVAEIDPTAHKVALGDGSRWTYGTLIWAAGADPRRLSCPSADLIGIHYMRDKADADRMMAELDGGARRVAIIGGGYIGLEAAAVLTKLGCTVTVLEAQPRVLARVAGEALSAFFAAQHRAHGVDLRCGVSVSAIEGADGRVSGVRLASGEVVPAGMVVAGIGIIPATQALTAAGAAGSNGVDVDAFCRTSLPDIYAIGDCAAHVSRFAHGERIRIESVQNASDMATAVARTICGAPTPYDTLPWFWSNQYDLKLQTVGLNLGHDATVLRGAPATMSFSVLYLREGRVIAIDSVNAVKDYVHGRKLIEAGAVVAPERLSDTVTPLKDLLPA